MCDGRFCKDCDRYGGVSGDGWCSHWQGVRRDYDTCPNFIESRTRIAKRLKNVRLFLSKHNHPQ